MIAPVEVVVVLNTDQTSAFTAFVENVNDWWPVESFSIAKGVVSIEPVLGGKITETSADGTDHVWGFITHWDPGNALDILWHVGGPAKKATEISVRFAPTDDGRTGITLVHTGWEILGDDGPKQRGNYQMGWDTILGEKFATFARNACPPLT